MKRALVLGGGGSVGVAWETGLLAGLMDGGVDVRDADLIVGTSAGAFVGTNIAHGIDPRDLLRRRRETTPAPSAAAREPDTAALQAIFTLWGRAETMTQEHCAQVGALALAANTATEDELLEGFGAHGWPGWPEKPLLITAVDCTSGERRAFESADGVPIDRAVAASCSVPGMFPPVTLGGRRYTDGGVWSMSNAGLAQRIDPDVVLIVSVFGAIDRGIHRLAVQQFTQEAAALEASGASVRILRFDDAAIEASGGMNLMDYSKAAATADAAEAHGRRIAPELRGWWHPS